MWLALGLAVASLAAWGIRVPGYMDAEYYFSTATELASGRGFTEPFLWNYLDDPRGMPHPSHQYWMPLASMVAALPMAILSVTFRVAQTPFILLTAMLPGLTIVVGRKLRLNERHLHGAAALAIVPGFYLPYFVTTDTFSAYAVVGALALISTAAAIEAPSPVMWLVAGLMIGLGHLTRADGLLLAVPALVGCLAGANRGRALANLLLGYLSIMSAWWLHNYCATGAVLPKGTSRALWLLGYDELFVFPASILTPQRWWGAGPGPILAARLHALWVNLQSLIAVNGMVFLGPLMVLGVRNMWRDSLVRVTVGYLAVLFTVMSVVFPFAGYRGGFFHSSAAVMPMLWALVPVGFAKAVDWGARVRGWSRPQAARVFAAAGILMAVVFTAVIYVRRVLGDVETGWQWEASRRDYEWAGQLIREKDLTPGVVAVNNPPGFFVATGLPAVVIPDGGPETLYEVVARYGVEWVVLEFNHPRGLDGAYFEPTTVPWLTQAIAFRNAAGKMAYVLRVAEPSEGG